MKRLIFTFTLLALVSCSKTDEQLKVTESQEIIVDSVSQHIERLNQQLEKSNSLEHNIKENIAINTKLTKKNAELKKELAIAKDSMVSLKKELVEVRSKLPKKKNFIQKIFNIAPDSVEVIQVDTLSTQ